MWWHARPLRHGMFVGCIISAVIGLAFLSSSATAQPQRKTQTQKQAGAYKPGDIVEVDWLGPTRAEVVSVNPSSGWVTVKFVRDGITLNPTLPPANVRPLSGAAAKKSSKAPAKTEQPIRTWTDRTGKHKIEARFVELKDNQVELRRQDGTVVRLALDRLSEDDQKVVKGLTESEADDNPFKPVENEPAEPAGEATPYAYPVTEAVWSSARIVQPLGAESWSVKSEAAAIPSFSKRVAMMLDVPRGGGAHSGFFENPQRLLFLPERGQVLIVRVDHAPNTQRSARVERCDLKAGKSLGAVPIPSSNIPVNVDPAGEKLLAMPGPHGVTHHKILEVWRLDGKNAEHVVSFDPSSQTHSKRTPSEGFFVSADHAITFDTFEGQAVLWNLPKATAEYTLSMQQQCKPALSSDRKYLAVMTASGVSVLDAASGELLGQVEGDADRQAVLSFRPDGKRLASSTPGRVRVWDLNNGKLVHEVWYPAVVSATSVDWFGDSFVLIDRQHLIDLDRRVVLWKYEGLGHQSAAAEFAGQFFYTIKGHNQVSLHSVTLPHDEAKRVASKLPPEQQLLAIKPGTPVRLDVRIHNNPAAASKITDLLKNKLSQAGLTVADNAAITLDAVVEPGKTEKVDFRNFGLGFKTTEAEVTERVSRLAFRESGLILWQNQAVAGAPHLVRRKENQSLEDAIEEQRGPVETFFEQTTIPRHLARHPAGFAYGTSVFTANGIAPKRQ